MKKNIIPKPVRHPDEEELARFAQGLPGESEKKRTMEHLISCAECARALALCLKAREAPEVDVPPGLIERLLPNEESAAEPWQIILRLKDMMFEIVNAAGDVLVGQEVVAMPVLRSRSIKQFKDELTLFREFRDIRVEARIVNKQGKSFDLSIQALNKTTNKPVKDMRVTLFRDDVELESYLSGAAGAIFEHVLLGKYKVELRDDTVFASIVLDIKT